MPHVDIMDFTPGMRHAAHIADKETQNVPDRRLGTKGYLSGDQGCFKEMEYADQELAAGNESFYYRVR